MSLRKTAVNGIKWTGLITIFQSLFQLIQVAILARILPREAFGLVALTLMVVNFTTMFMDMGLNAAILHRQNSTREEYSSLFFLSLLVSLLLYGLLLLIAPVVAVFYQEEQLSKLIPLLGLNVLFIALGRQHHTVLQKEFKFESIAKASLVSVFSGLVVGVGLALMGFGVYSLVFSSLTVALILNGWMILLNTRTHPLQLRLKFSELKPYLKVGGYNMGSNLMDFFYRESDTLIIGKIMGADTLGLYSLAKQLVLKLFNILNPILMNVLNPIVSSIQHDKELVKKSILKAVSLLSAIALPAFALMGIFAFPILLVIYGSDYTSGWIVLSAISFSYFIQTIYSPSGSLQIATGRTDIGFHWTMLQAIVTPLVVFISAHYGINIMAISVAILNLFLVLPHWRVQYKRMADISLKEYLNALSYPFRLFTDSQTPEMIYRKTSEAIYELIRKRSVYKSRKVEIDDYRSIPIIINNRNRITFLQQLIEALEKRGYTNLIILDNNSTWQPLLDYYKNLPYRVVFLKQNLGYNALQQIPLYKEIRKGYFVYTDSDVVPTEQCPDDFMLKFLELLRQNEHVQKVGFSLKIDDLPECFDDRQKIIDWEQRYYVQPAEEGVYEALIDTTFALHRPYALLSTVGGYRMLRTAAPYEAKHMPWYNDSSALTEEECHYINNVEIGTHWSKGISIKRNSLWKRMVQLVSYW